MQTPLHAASRQSSENQRTFHAWMRAQLRRRDPVGLAQGMKDQPAAAQQAACLDAARIDLPWAFGMKIDRDRLLPRCVRLHDRKLRPV